MLILPGFSGIVTLGAGEENIDLDVGITHFASLGDTVFEDTDGDGTQGTSEPGVSGVVVNLLDGAGNPVLDSSNNPVTTTTAADGTYLFDNLPPGDYQVEFVAPSGRQFTLQDTGADDAIDSDANPTTGLSQVVTLGSEDEDLTIDAGLTPLPPTPASLGDRVWFDIDADGIQDASEPGINGIDIRIDVDTDGDGNPDYTETTTTSGDGEYLFPTLPAGTVTVTMVNPPAGYRGTFSADGGATDDFVGTLNSGENPRNVDFGLTGNSSLAGTVHEDGVDDATEPFFIDGVQDTGEPGIPNVTITLEGVTDSGISFTKTTTTDGNGDYDFGDLPPGTYTIIETQPTSAPLTASSPNYVDGLDTIGSLGGTAAGNSLTADQHSSIFLGIDEDGVDYDFSEIPEARTDGYVFVDSNDNAVFDPGERGIPGATVTLVGTDVFGTPVTRTAITDSNGFYEFTGLYAGTYDLLEVQPTQFDDGQEQNGSVPVIVSNDNFSNLALTWGDNTFSYNFGELESDNTTSGNPPVLRGLPPFTPFSRIDPRLGGPGPIYPGIPIYANGDVLSLDSGRPVGGGYSLDNRLMEGCGCQEIVDPCNVCDEPIVVDACGEEVVCPSTPVELVLPVLSDHTDMITGVVEVPVNEEIAEVEDESNEELVLEEPDEEKATAEDADSGGDFIPPPSSDITESIRIDEAEAPNVPNVSSFLQRFTGWLGSNTKSK